MTPRFGALSRTLACLALAALVHALAPPPDALRTGLALFVLIGGLWMTQALHLSITALLVPLLAVLSGLMGVRAAHDDGGVHAHCGRLGGQRYAGLAGT